MSIYYDKRNNRWCLDINVDGQQLHTSAADTQVLERMRSIIQTNKLPYNKAKRLAEDYKQNKIHSGYIGHQYLCPDLGYRIILAYGNGDGFIHTYYDNLKDAWQDPRIQERLAGVSVQYTDYDTYCRTVDSGKPWTLMGLTILRCKICRRGNIRIVRNQARTMTQS
jgi:hypothetical protein